LPDYGAIPRSAQTMHIDDPEGNQLWRFTVLTDFVDNYLQEARRQGFNFRKFHYDYEKYKQEQEVKTKLEQRHEYLKVRQSEAI
jgi:hypothetical protein